MTIAHSAHPPAEDQDHPDQDQDHRDQDQSHHEQDERPHACNDGWVTIGQIVVDEETCEETEEFALYLCRKCAERSYGVESAD